MTDSTIATNLPPTDVINADLSMITSRVQFWGMNILRSIDGEDDVFTGRVYVYHENPNKDNDAPIVLQYDNFHHQYDNPEECLYENFFAFLPLFGPKFRLDVAIFELDINDLDDEPKKIGELQANEILTPPPGMNNEDHFQSQGEYLH